MLLLFVFTPRTRQLSKTWALSSALGGEGEGEGERDGGKERERENI